MPTAEAEDRPLTVDDVVQKTALNAVLAIGVGVASAVVGLGIAGILGGFIVGLVLALIIIFKQSTNKFLVLGYSIAEGVALAVADRGPRGQLEQLRRHRLPGPSWAWSASSSGCSWSTRPGRSG